jgi:outer membrane protein assembly factor BamB
VINERIFVVEGAPGEKNRSLKARNLTDGKVLWTQPVESSATGQLVADGKRLLAATLDRGLVCMELAQAPQERWRYTSGVCVGMPLSSDGRVIVTLDQPPRLSVLDAATGVELWTRPLAAVPLTGPVLSGETICVSLPKGLAGFALIDGTPCWESAETGKADQPLFTHKKWIACTSQAWVTMPRRCCATMGCFSPPGEAGLYASHWMVSFNSPAGCAFHPNPENWRHPGWW